LVHGENVGRQAWLDEAQRELVGRNLRLSRRIVPSVGGITQEIAFRVKDEAGPANFVEHYRFVDPMKRFALRRACSGPAGMIDQDIAA
jgi:hypothetical protein